MRTLVIILMFLLFGSPVNATETAKNYFSIKGAFLSLSDSGFNGDLEGAKITFDSGFGVSGAIGTTFNPLDFASGQFRGEVELGYGESAMLHIKSKLDHDLFDTNLQNKKLMANFYYDHKLKKGKLSPYVGGGLGWVWAKDGEDFIDDNAFAYQAMAGVTYEVNPSISLIVGAKYFRSQQIRVNTNLSQVPGRLKNADGEAVNPKGEVLGRSDAKYYRYNHTDKWAHRGDALPVSSYTNLESLNLELGIKFAF